jgi:hypothetical protein
MQAREHGTRAAAAAAAALAGDVAPVSGSASLDGAAAVTSLPRVASSPALLSPARIEYVSVAAGAAAHGNLIIDIAVADFDPTAELAVRTAEHALLLAARDSELAALREQYDLLAVRYDDNRAPIDVDAIGAARTCFLSGCDRRTWPGHNYCGKAHATQAGALGGPGGAKFPTLREVFQPPDSGWASGDRAAASAFGGDEDAVGLSAPPLPRPGSFGRAEPASPFPGLSHEWDRWRITDPTKAKAFTKHDWEALAGCQSAGRIVEALPASLDFVASGLEIDSEAAAVLCQVQDAIASLVESLQRSTDRYTLRWTHSAERFEAFQLFSQLYEAQTAGPKCMHPGNIALQHQVALADLKSCKATLSKSAARGGTGDGPSRRSNNGGRRYTQQAAAPEHAARGGTRGGGAGASGAKRGGGAGVAGTPQ